MPYVVAQPCVDVKDKACVTNARSIASTRAPVPCISIRTNAWIAAHANRCVRPKPSSMKMICQTSGPGTRMPQSASSLKSAIWAALPQRPDRQGSGAGSCSAAAKSVIGI